MNEDILKGKWKQLIGDAKKRWGKLTDNELIETQGVYDKLVGKLRESYGYQRDQAQRELDDFLSSYEDKKVLAGAGKAK